MELILPDQNNDEIISDAEVRFLELKPELQEDPTKIRVFVKKTISKSFPTLEIEIRDKDQNLITETVIISAFQKELVFTLHLPKNISKQNEYLLIGKIIFEDPIGLVHQIEMPFLI